VLTDKTGLTGGLSRALATDRLLTHDRGRVRRGRGWNPGIEASINGAARCREAASRRVVSGRSRADTT
jgi:hypothetical protein